MVTQLTLLCLPYSGASAMVYSRWRPKLPQWLQLKPVELPGRGARFDEPLQTDMRVLAMQLAKELQPTLKTPYALFGHSLGALLACEIAHALRALGCAEPVALFASGTAAPTQRADYDRGFAIAKTDAELIDQLRTLNGTSEEVLANDELMSLTLPILRADFLLCGSFTYGERQPLALPIHVFGGKQDSVRADQLLDWQLDAASGFSLDMFDGHHFFLVQHESAVLRCVRRYADEHLARWRIGAARQLVAG
ncbi:MAG: thioesterase domain-containing protein [Pseudomonas sp.]